MAVVYSNAIHSLNFLKVHHRIHQFLLQVLDPLHVGQVVAVHRNAVLSFALLGSCPELVNNALDD